MGMFDSFVVNYNNTTHEVQTKRFENVLDTWRVGDVINQPSFGVQVLYELAEEVDNRLEYAFPEDANTVVYIIIANGVYVESIVDTYTQNTDIADRINALEGSWLDSNKQLTSFNTHLAAKQALNKTYRASIGKLKGYIEHYNSPPDAEGTLGATITDLHYPKLKNIKTATDLVDVLLAEINIALSEQSKPTNVVYDIDPLARYRV